MLPHGQHHWPTRDGIGDDAAVQAKDRADIRFRQNLFRCPLRMNATACDCDQTVGIARREIQIVGDDEIWRGRGLPGYVRDRVYGWRHLGMGED